jgi:hypothetical protein
MVKCKRVRCKREVIKTRGSMKTVIIRDRRSNKIVKKFKIPDHVADTVYNIGGLSMDNYFKYEIN